MNDFNTNISMINAILLINDLTYLKYDWIYVIFLKKSVKCNSYIFCLIWNSN